MKKPPLPASARSLEKCSALLRREHLVLAALFILAFILRLQVDPGIPFHFDPGKNLVFARAALDWFPLVPQYNPYFNLGEYYEYQVLFPYLVSLIHTISGFSLVEIAKWLVILVGSALVVTVYLLAAEVFRNPAAGLVSAFLAAVSGIQLFQFVNYYPQILAMTLMPLSFFFLIQYMKRQEYRFLAYTIVSATLIVLASYIAALVYFIILLLSLAIWSVSERKALKLFSIPLVSAGLLAFFWFPMIWRSGQAKTVTKAVVMVTHTTQAFTDMQWTLEQYLCLSCATLLAIGAGICALLIVKKIRWDFQAVLMAVWSAATLVLATSFLWRPVLWVDRFFPFFDIAMCICAGGTICILVRSVNGIRRGPGWKGYLILLVLLVPLLTGVFHPFAFRSWGYPSDFAMAGYMQEHVPEGSLVAAPPGIQGFWFSALSGQRILGGDSAQMFRHRFSGDGASNRIINANDTGEKMSLIREYGVNYIVVPAHKDVPLIWDYTPRKAGLEGFNNETFFEVEKMYLDDYGFTALIKVRENQTPKYHAAAINWGATAAGYTLSFLCLGGLVFWPAIRKRITPASPEKSL